MGEHTISITTGTILKTLLILSGAWLLFYLRDLVLVVLTAIVISSAMEPAIKFFTRWRIPRLLGVITIYLSLFLFVFSIFYFFVPLLMADLVEFISNLPQYLETLNQMAFFQDYAAMFGISPAQLAPAETIEQLRQTLSFYNFFGSSFSAAASVVGGVFSFLLIIVLSFYFTMRETGVDDFLSVVVPDKYKPYALDLWNRTRHKIGLWMQGQLVLGLLIGVMVWLCLMIIGVRHALLLAVLAACFELIPVFGPVLAAVPAVIIGFVDGGPMMGVGVIVLYIILQQFENHLIYPAVVTQVVGVPPILVILGLIIGANLGGFLGILLSVPVAAALQELINDVKSRRSFAVDAKSI